MGPSYELSSNRSLSGMDYSTITRPIIAFLYLVVDRMNDAEKIKDKQKSPSSLQSGRRAIALVLPPSFVAASRQQPQ